MQCVGSSSGVQSYSDVAHSAPCSSPLCSFACRRAASFPVANGSFRPSSLKVRSKSESEALNKYEYRLNSSFIDFVPISLWQQQLRATDSPNSNSSDSEDDASSGVSSAEAVDDSFEQLGFDLSEHDSLSTHTIVSTGRPKKSVRFADDCGGDLETIRIMTEPSDYPPRISPSVLRRLRGEAGDHTLESQDCATWTVPFKQPASEYVRFRERLDKGKVALENVMLKNDVCKMAGTIKVVNFAFEKRVFLRITDNGWKNFLDRPATFQPSSSKSYDTFSFDIDIPPNTKPDSKIEFCICYIAAGEEYWDSNEGINYILKSPPLSEECSQPVPSGKTQRDTDSDDAYRLSYDDWTKFGSWKSLRTDDRMAAKTSKLFSMNPPASNTVSIGCQVSEKISLLSMCEVDLPNFLESEIVEVGTERIPIHAKSKTVSEKAVQTDASSSPIQTTNILGTLISLFPTKDLFCMKEDLKTNGLSTTVKKYLSSGAEVDLSANVLDVTDQELGLELPLTSDNSDSTDSASTFSLTDSHGYETALSCMSADDSEDDVPDGFLRIELSADTLNQLCGFFGDGVDTSGLSSTVELSYAVCHEIFKAAATKHLNNELEKTKCDELLALELQMEFNNEPKKEPVYTEVHNNEYKKLCAEFPTIPNENVKDVFRDTDYCYTTTRDTLTIFAAENAEVTRNSGDRRRKPTKLIDLNMKIIRSESQWQPVAPRRMVENKGKEKTGSIINARETAQELMLESKADYAKYQECIRKALINKVSAPYYWDEATLYKRKAEDKIQEANEIICADNINSDQPTVDMHLLKVPNALKLLKQKLSQLDLDLNFRNKRSNRYLRVITGYGKSSNGNCKLKPAVKNWLDQHKYEYSFTNSGEFQILCK